MKKISVILFLLVTIVAITQDVTKLKEVKPTEDFENIWVKKIADNSEQTSFIIWVKKNVRLHKHEYHSESIYVLGGKGEMTINDEKFVIKKGDYFNIPKNTAHSLNVLSSTPIKVLSIQSPKFEGKDRIYLEK
jgi:quercetin dioxygenase-like cupin family protein